MAAAEPARVLITIQALTPPDPSRLRTCGKSPQACAVSFDLVYDDGGTEEHKRVYFADAAFAANESVYTVFIRIPSPDINERALEEAHKLLAELRIVTDG